MRVAFQGLSIPLLAVPLALMLLTGGCENQGFSGLRAELNRVNSPYHVVNVSHQRAVVSAKGRQIAVEPAPGFCIARESIETGGRSAFVLIGDCAFETPDQNAGRTARGELRLPRSVPGILTVSISGDPGILEETRDATLSELSAFLDTPDGRALLGRSTQSKVDVLETRRIGDALYVLVDDPNGQVIPILSSVFWRAFTTLNERLAVVTVSGFRDKPLGRETMLEHLVQQVDTLKQANRRPVNERPTLIAEAPRPDVRREQGSAELARADVPVTGQNLRDLKPTAVIVSTPEAGKQEIWPMPQTRPGTGIGPTEPPIVATPRTSPVPARPAREAAGTEEPVATETAATRPELVNPAAADEDDDGTVSRFAPEYAPTAPRRRKPT